MLPTVRRRAPILAITYTYVPSVHHRSRGFARSCSHVVVTSKVFGGGFGVASTAVANQFRVSHRWISPIRGCVGKVVWVFSPLRASISRGRKRRGAHGLKPTMSPPRH